MLDVADWLPDADLVGRAVTVDEEGVARLTTPLTDREIVTYRLLAGEPPAEIADDLGLDVWSRAGEGGVVDCVVLPGCRADDGNAEVEYELADTAAEAAREYVNDGDWGDRSTTSWIRVYVWRMGLYLEDGAVNEATIDREPHTVMLAAEEPECEEGEDHDWQSPLRVVGGIAENPGVWGHGGGVIITEVCAHCGTYRVTDTWAQDPETGEQGLRSVEYRDADDASLAWARAGDAGR